MIITPYNELQNFSTAPLTEDGVWSLVSGPPTPPDPPITWDGTIEFDLTDIGVYTYRYTVECGYFADLIVNRSVAAPRPNDDCLNASNISSGSITNQNSALQCPDFQEATDSGLVSPWGTGTFKDLWYKVNQLSTGTTLSVSVDGSPYTAGGINEPVIAFYGACGEIIPLASASQSFGSQFNSLNYTLTSDISPLFIRVSGIPGRFDLEIEI